MNDSYQITQIIYNFEKTIVIHVYYQLQTYSYRSNYQSFYHQSTVQLNQITHARCKMYTAPKLF